MPQPTTQSTTEKILAANQKIASLGSQAKVKIYTSGQTTLLATFTLGATPAPATTTVDAGTDVFTLNNNGFSLGTPLTYTTTGTLPAPLVVGTTYYARDTTTNNYKVSATPNGTAINITNTGTGTHTVQAQAYNVSATGVITSNNGSNLFTTTGVASGTAAEAVYTRSDDSVVFTTNVGLQPISFTVNTGTDVITAPYHNFANGDFVKFFGVDLIGSNLPSPLTGGVEYEVSDVANAGLVNASFKVWRNRAVVDITTAGTAPMTVSTGAGVQLNTGSSTVPSLDISSGMALALAPISITIL